eukprot:TRINITY_DN616_c6_g1_i1.p1 TRINITY_DN616_c6_g1~~TRINITY_DN616_c6_g1_i1.p1  ORF type:complete len:210 (+),score=20.93 TRINITY_DN616_c6_g1_i1:49-678(+)
MPVKWKPHIPNDLPGDLIVPEDKGIKVLTLVAVVRGEGKTQEILLGRKARGFGKDKWNGFGGKVEAGETIEAAAKRELREESGLKAEKMDKTGVMFFWFLEEEPHLMEVHLFVCTSYSGTIEESEEMNPIQWFSPTAVPYSLMWPDDKFWLPRIFSPERKPFLGKFEFSNLSEMGSFEIHDIDKEYFTAFRIADADTNTTPSCVWAKKN